MLHRFILVALAIALALPTAALAHEGHKMMGTVTMVAPDHVMMKAKDGKEITISVNAKTKVLRGKTRVKITDVKEGTRIVATVASHAAPFTASQIDVGKATEAAPKK
jgi:ABC-type amino acid transport substrate-binding protein